MDSGSETCSRLLMGASKLGVSSRALFERMVEKSQKVLSAKPVNGVSMVKLITQANLNG